MASPTDPIDERGHTYADAAAQEPLFDDAADPASQTPPGNEDGSPSGDVIVPAQSVAEVTAQIENPAGEEEGSASS